jgi:hypothetical protein
MSTVDIVCAPDGTLTAIWDDELAGLLSEGQPTISRVSHVEPTQDGQWTADLSPVNGPVLGPYPLRREALDAELVWLRESMGF